MIPLQITFFGTFRVRHDSHSITAFRAEKVRALLIYLALEHGRVHRRETLAVLLWEDLSHKAALNNLRKSLFRLRRALDSAHDGLSDRLLTITREDVAWHHEHVHLDATRFLARSDPDHNTAEQLRTAADLYREELLPGFNLSGAGGFEEWLGRRREQFHQRALALYTHLAHTAFAAGDDETARRYAQRQLALEPLHEPAYQCLLRIYQRRGRRAEALALYDTCAQLLRAELGVAPTAETQAVYAQLLDHDAFGDNGHAPRLHGFSTADTPFLGRTADLERLVNLLIDPACRLITITGLGGMGKTRLAQQLIHQWVATAPDQLRHHFPDGCHFISLVDLTDTNALWSRLAQQFQIALPGDKPLAAQVRAHLQTRRLLLVLDNAEHLLPEIAGWIADLLNHLPQQQCLVTSRVPLQVQAEWGYPLDGLGYTADAADASAKHLFVQAARRFRPQFQPTTADLQAIHTICRLTGGLPLAIEMAAAQIRFSDCAAIARNVDRDGTLLTAPWTDLPARQKSMDAILQETWRRLSSAARKGLASFTLFPGPADRDAFTAVLPQAWAAVAELTDHFLLQYTPPDTFTLHPLVRQFATARRKETAVDETAVRHRHAEHYLRRLPDEVDHLNTPQAGEAMHRLRARWLHIMAAWQHAIRHEQWELVITAAPAVAAYCRIQVLVPVGEDALAAVLNVMPADHPGRWYIGWQRARLMMDADYARAETLFARLTNQPIPPQDAPRFWAEYGATLWRLNRLPEAEAHLQHALALTADNPLPFALHHIGNLHLSQHHLDEAHLFLSQALHAYRRSQNVREQAGMLNDMAVYHNCRGETGSAAALLQESLDLYRQVNHRWGIGMVSLNLVYMNLVLGRLQEAQNLGTELLMHDTVQSPDLALLRAHTHLNLGHVYAAREMYTVAVNRYFTAIEWFWAHDDMRGLVEGLVGWAHVVCAHGRTEEAAVLVGVIDKLHKHEMSIDVYEQKLLADLEERLPRLLGAAAFDRHVAEGRTAVLDEVVHRQILGRAEGWWLPRSTAEPVNGEDSAASVSRPYSKNTV